MKDFAKSIVCNVKAEVEKVLNYNPKDYENDPRHKWTVKSIENEIEKTRRRIDLNRRRIQDLRSMVNSRQFGASTLKELKDEEKDYEANQMKIKQLVSMLHRATGNELPDDMISVGNAYTYAGNIPIEKIPDNWRPEFPKAGYVVYYAPNKAKWFATEVEAKKFAEEQDRKNKTGNSKVGNEIKDDIIRAHPGDSLAKKIKSSATYEAIKRQPWKVYDILGVGDSMLREYAFEAVSKKYNIPYDDIYNAWMKSRWPGVGNSKAENSGWKQGTSGNFEWNILSFDEPSEYGINNGRISKLFIRDKTTYKVEANYDRGWDVRPSQKVKSLYDELIRRYN